MKRLKNILNKIFFPPAVFRAAFTVLSAVLLAVVFLNHLNRTPAAYAIYPFTAYTLIILILAAVRKIQSIKQLILDKSALFRKYSTDMDFKAEVSLYLSLGINLGYSVYKAAAGILYHSLWFGTVAFYYIILSVGRFLLLRDVRKEKDVRDSLKKYCLCGYLLLILTIAIIGMSIYMIHDGKVSTYPGHIIYAAAGYTFYSFISAVINSFKFRKFLNPLYHASKMITLATALVSVFSLQTAMFAAFGTDISQQRFMNITTGFVIFLIVIGIALYMIIRGKLLLRKREDG